MQVKLRWITILAFGYLIFPFIIFCVGFLKYSIGLPASLIILWIYYQIIQNSKNNETISFTKKEIFISVIIILIWVWLSGIGGFAFQNWDHHFRNAIFHDLINYSWPVYYSNFENPNIGLVYYIGYWLPSALVGKLLGWQAANGMLFLWSVFGLMITVMLLKSRLRISTISITLLMVFFSGMDILGQGFVSLIDPEKVSLLWPPISHLEGWAYHFQYSSMSTQLFWVFNQAIPTWLCMSIILAKLKPKFTLLIWSLCFFYSPIPAIGMIPIAAIEIINRLKQGISNNKIAKYKRKILTYVKSLVKNQCVQAIANILGFFIVFTITASYFMINRTSSSLCFQQISINFVFFYLFFLLLEGFLLWILLKNSKEGKITWIIVGLIFFSCPLFKIGEGVDFLMRASIPMLFLLMVWSGEKLRERGELRVQIPLLIFLIIGGLTPLYELNRSIYRSFDYYLHHTEYANQQDLFPIEAIQVPTKWENDHPFTLVADGIKSFSLIPLENSTNFLASFQDTIFQKVFARDDHS